MSTRASFFHSALMPTGTMPAAETRCTAVSPRNWDAGRFAEDQIRRLVRQVFFPGWPKPAHHVAFAAVDDTSDAGPICLKVGEILSSQAPGKSCVVDAFRNEQGPGAGLAQLKVHSTGEDNADPVQGLSHRLSSNLWLMPYEIFSESPEEPLKQPVLEAQIKRLRAEYDYTVIHLPPVGAFNDAVLLGQLSDGVVLIVEANSTRRAAAQRVKEILLAANVRLLGTVLNGRTFPIPRSIYQKL